MAEGRPDLVLLHTAEVHVARFDEIAQRIAPKAALQHHIRPEWLALAREHGLTESLKAGFAEFVRAQPAPVLCTCTSLCAPSMALLRECLEEAGHEPRIRAIEITEAWPAFEAGDEPAFTQAIARAIRLHLAAFPDTRAVVLAQASMSGAAPLLPDAPPVLTSPESALRAALAL